MKKSHLLLIVVLVGAAAMIGYYVAKTQNSLGPVGPVPGGGGSGTTSAQEDDDRPPIIISSGSVRIDSTWDHMANDKGRFEMEGTDARKWSHKYTNSTNPTLAMRMFLDGWKPKSTAAACVDKYLKVSAVTVKYHVGLANRTFVISIVSGKLLFQFDNEDPKNRMPHRLKLGGLATGLDEMLITHADGVDSCVPDDEPTVVIRQVYMK